MRIYPEWVKTTQKEDGEIYRALVDATLADPSPQQLRVMAEVKHHHLDHNRDLTSALYNSFLTVLEELGVEIPVVKLNRRDLEAGSWYIIPGPGKLQGGKNKEQRLAMRLSKRQKLFLFYSEAAGYTPGELDLYLATEESTMGKIRGLVIEWTQESGERIDALEKQVAALSEKVSQLCSSASCGKGAGHLADTDDLVGDHANRSVCACHN